MVGRRAGAVAGACVVAAAGLAACGQGGRLNAEDPPTSLHRFPAAVVSTTTLVPPPFGVPRAPTTTTTRKSSGPSSATSTTAANQPPPRVSPAATPMPAARTEVAGAGWQGFVVVAGGLTASGTPSARVDSYDPVSGAWQRGPDLPAAIYNAALTALGDDLYLIGGFTVEGDQPIAVATTYVFHSGDTAWKTGPNLQTPRGGPAAASIGDTIVVLGGATTDGGDLDTVETLAQGDTAWKDGKPLIQKRAYASALVSGGRVYAAGGRVGGVSGALTSAESWKPGDDHWRIESGLAEARASAGGAANCVAGGENGGGAVGSIECITDRKWSTAFHMDLPRHGLAAAVIDGWLHLIGGGPRPGPTVNAAHEIFDLTA